MKFNSVYGINAVLQAAPGVWPGNYCNLLFAIPYYGNRFSIQRLSFDYMIERHLGALVEPVPIEMNEFVSVYLQIANNYVGSPRNLFVNVLPGGALPATFVNGMDRTIYHPVEMVVENWFFNQQVNCVLNMINNDLIDNYSAHVSLSIEIDYA